MSDKAPAADRDPQDEIMPAALMKPVLTKAKTEKVSVVVGLTKTKDGLIMLHAKMPPKKLRGTLLKAAKQCEVDLVVQTVRFGTASIAPDDTSVLTLTLNKPPVSGLDMKLKIALRNTPCKMVQFAE